MFKLNFKIALRNILKNKLSSVINIGGLAIGLSACLLLLLYASYEWNYDKQYKNAEHIYQAMVNLEDVNGTITRTVNLSQNILASTLKEDFPEIGYISRATHLSKRLIAVENNGLKINSRYADPEFLKVFNYQFISGHPGKALSDPNSIVLTESTAKRLFGTTDVLNRTLRFENQADLKITAVVRDIPSNVTYTFEALTPWALFEKLNQWPAKPNWGNHDFFTVMTLDKKVDIAQLNVKVKDVVKKHSTTAREELFIYPLTELHLYGDFKDGKPVGGKILQVQLYVCLAIGILLIACINFINLSTAHSRKRAKEVGIKKTIGATKKSLVFQFLLESVILTTISMVAGIVIVELCLPWFNNLLEIKIVIDYLNPSNWITLLGGSLLTSCLAGFYPAFYLSGFNPVQILKKENNAKKAYALSLRQVFVIVQFSFAIILIASTVTISKQVNFIRNRPLGYNSNALIEIPHEGLLYEKYDLLKTRLLATGAVTSLTQSSNSITSKKSSIRGLQWEGMSEADKLIDFDQLYTTYDFIKTTGVQILAGRDYSEDYSSDTSGVLLSEKAVKVMNLKNPIGKQIIYQGKRKTVIGVFEDIIWGDLSKFEEPMVVTFAEDISDVITMRLDQQKSLSESIAAISAILKELNPNFPVEIKFIDSLNEAKLKNEATLMRLANIFGGLALIISCLGLFGLSLYSAEQRTKEIGIRKVLGASVFGLMKLLSLNFVKLVGISIFISVPVAYFMMDTWLHNFDLQTPLSLWIFLFSGVFTILIAVLTVSWQSYKVASANPVNALKYE
jgi:putative ABC transport system permease protein